MKNMKRAERRHHRERLLKKRYHQAKQWYYIGHPPENPESLEDKLRYQARLRLHTPCMCSCTACGNPRKHNVDEPLTLQERKSLISFFEQVEDFCDV